METPNDSNQFDPLNWLTKKEPRELEILFEKATLELSAKPWVNLFRHSESWIETIGTELWQRVLPYPVPRPESRLPWNGRYTQNYSIWLENEKEWRWRALKWLEDKHAYVALHRRQVKEYVHKGIGILNKEYGTDLNEGDIVKKWYKSIVGTTLTDFEKIVLSADNIGKLMAEEGDKERQKFIPIISKIDPKRITVKNNSSKIYERERALIHCYQQLTPIKKGEPLYNDYVAFATPKKRLAYPNDSKKRADALIASITKILPHLNEVQRQQAESEIKTIEANFSN